MLAGSSSTVHCEVLLTPSNVVCCNADDGVPLDVRAALWTAVLGGRVVAGPGLGEQAALTGGRASAGGPEAPVAGN